MKEEKNKKLNEYRSVSVKKSIYLKLKKIAIKEDTSINKVIQRLIDKNGKDNLF